MYLLLYPELLGIEFLASCILRKCSAIELHIQSPRESLKFLLFIFVQCVYVNVYLGTQVPWHMSRIQKITNWMGFILFFYHIGLQLSSYLVELGYQTQVIRFDSKSSYSLRHLAGLCIPPTQFMRTINEQLLLLIS